MNNKIDFSDLIDRLHRNLDRFKEEWIKMSHIDNELAPLEIHSYNSGSVFEQFVKYTHTGSISFVDIDKYIDSIGLINAFAILKNAPPNADCYKIENNKYYCNRPFCIPLHVLKEKLLFMTQGKKVKVTLSYTDCNNPYAYEPDVRIELDSYFDIQDWINKRTSRRESYDIKDIEWVPIT